MGGWGGEAWQPTFDAVSKNTKIKNSHFHRWVGGLLGNVGSQLLMLSPKNAKIPYSHFCRWVGGCGVDGSQLLMLSPNLLKSKKNYYQGFG